jgi:hypothetical protein
VVARLALAPEQGKASLWSKWAAEKDVKSIEAPAGLSASDLAVARSQVIVLLAIAERALSTPLVV